MSNFNLFIPLLIQLEGGYTDNPNDNGNWTGGKKGLGQLIGTKYGISAPVLGQYLKRFPTVQDMKSLSLNTAKEIYRLNYWNAMRASEIKSQSVANIYVDFGINSGPGVAIREMQRTLNTQFSKELKEDGAIGPITLSAINSVNSESLFNHYKERRRVFFLSLNQPTFINGWLNRLNAFVYEKKK
jgi:lysozyme family protein